MSANNSVAARVSFPGRVKNFLKSISASPVNELGYREELKGVPKADFLAAAREAGFSRNFDVGLQFGFKKPQITQVEALPEEARYHRVGPIDTKRTLIFVVK